jgi:hypothetical protein
MQRTSRHPARRMWRAAWLGAMLALAGPALAQNGPSTWSAEPAKPQAPQAPLKTSPPGVGPNTTAIPRTTTEAKGAPANAGLVSLVALLTADGQRIDQGLVWRVFQDRGDQDGKHKLVATNREATPTLKLQAGDYVVNAAFGRSHLTRRIHVQAGATTTEPFVLNAGGLRVMAVLGRSEAPANIMSYSIYSDERDQFGNRATVMTGAKPGLIIRLNAGIYHIVSTYGDANATVRTDVTVEAGKLTEATVSHTAAKVTLKLVARSGGDALPDTVWTLQTPQGEVVKESVGALPTHILAPGAYTAVAKSQGRAFRRDFTVANGDAAQVEVMMQ